MNTKPENLNNTYTEVPGTEEYSSKKINKFSVILFIGCIILSAAIWCYANFINDPMMEKEIMVNFVLKNGASHEYLSPAFSAFTFYGEKSVLDNMNVVTIEVDRSLFDSYGDPTSVPIKYADNFHSHISEVILELMTSSNTSNDKTTDK